MTPQGAEFLAWVMEQRPAGITPERAGEKSVRIQLDDSHAEVNLYPFEGSDICELRIVRESDEDSTFFLHFMLDDPARARELFGEMAEVIEGGANATTTPVLLCCTSAMTTSLFAHKMGEAAEAMGLPYEFSAVSVDRALGTDGDGFAAILVAPQAGYMRRQLAEAHPHTLVFEIPAKVFGSYDAPAAVRLLAHALRDDQPEQADGADLRAARDLPIDYRILVITFFSTRGGARLGYRLYDHGRPITEGVVRKPVVDFRDIEDLIQTMGARGVNLSTLDAIGIAVPGITAKGMVRLMGFTPGNEPFNLGPHLMARFGLPVLVHNNCNAAAVACYNSQDEFENVIFFRQELGHEAGGFGTVLNGELHRGKGSLAGETKFFETRFAYEPYGSYDESRWSAGGMFQIATNVLLAASSLIAPDVAYVAVDTVDDMDALRDALAEEISPDLLPELRVADDYIGLVYLGTMELCARQLHDGISIGTASRFSPAELVKHFQK